MSRVELDRFEYSRLAMGVEARIVLYAPSALAGDSAADAAFAAIADLDATLSDWNANSELERLVRAAHSAPVAVSADLFEVLQRSVAIARQTDGAFDPTIGPLVALWRAARTSHVLPAPEALAAARALVGIDGLELDERAQAVRLTRAGMRLDLGGIGKGYACQRAIETLARLGIASALVEMGGDIVCSRAPPGRAGWDIDPAWDDAAGHDRLSVEHCAVSTSGDREQWVEIDGRRYSHVVDPRTGLGLENRAHVVVLARDGATSDALATALSTLGVERALELLRRFEGVEAWLSEEYESNRHVRITPGLHARFRKNRDRL
ncbi:MAG: FAD:protein FMN transferase [Planctomycetes bacterium]|nr:FAD:protein FMN transferase [Planctomycetota bacterium]